MAPRLTTMPTRLQPIEQRSALPPPKRAEPFYLTAEWRRLMGQLIYERGKACERCGRKDCRIFGDHIIELKDGGPALEASNIMLLCGACHTSKTNAARAARMKG